jgi:hypothetical protein
MEQPILFTKLGKKSKSWTGRGWTQTSLTIFNFCGQINIDGVVNAHVTYAAYKNDKDGRLAMIPHATIVYNTSKAHLGFIDPCRTKAPEIWSSPRICVSREISDFLVILLADFFRFAKAKQWPGFTEYDASFHGGQHTAIDVLAFRKDKDEIKITEEIDDGDPPPTE